MTISPEYIAFGALLVSLAGLLFNGRKDARQEVANNARISAQLDTIQAGVEDIRVDLRTMRDRIEKDSERITVLETKIKGLEKEVYRHE